MKPVGRFRFTASSVSPSTLPSWVRKSSSSVLRSLEFAGESDGKSRCNILLTFLLLATFATHPCVCVCVLQALQSSRDNTTLEGVSEALSSQRANKSKSIEGVIL